MDAETGSSLHVLKTRYHITRRPALTGVEKKGAGVRVFSTKVHSTTLGSPLMAASSRLVKTWPA
jgi:hypothetical protein